MAKALIITRKESVYQFTVFLSHTLPLPSSLVQSFFPFLNSTMVNWESPVLIANELTSLIKFIHVIDGIYLWEFICNLGFEWGLASRRRQWRWTALLYIATRVATLSDVMTELVGLNILDEFNCKLWTHFVVSFRYLAITLALSLFSLRAIAIWQRSVPVTILSIAVVVANVGAWIYRVSNADAVWVPAMETCMFTRTRSSLLPNCFLLATEMFFIVLMATGIYKHNPGPRAFKVMYREGLLWLVVATLVEIVPIVFLILNLNDIMNAMYIAPSVLCTSIGATRMYRTLSDRQSGNMYGRPLFYVIATTQPVPHSHTHSFSHIADLTFGRLRGTRRRARSASVGRPNS
ncbi:hypothetical protein F5888DRAFT_1705862 [Russula emetica]|nr:hypothetical protein F5888DRAFT_1705862 [Russula emetica]